MTQRTLAGNTPPATCPSWLVARHIIIMQKCETQQQKKRAKKLTKQTFCRAQLSQHNSLFMTSIMFARGRYTNKAHTHSYTHTHSLEVKRAQWGALNPQQADRQASKQAGGSCHSVAPRGMLHICRHLQLSNDTAKEIAAERVRYREREGDSAKVKVRSPFAFN